MLRLVDTETTGFEGGIVEIASVDIVNGVICNPMSDLVRPPEEIGFAAMAVHHITEDMVADAPLISDVIGRYLAPMFTWRTTPPSTRASYRRLMLRGFAR